MDVDEAIQKMDELQINVTGTSSSAKELEAEVKVEGMGNAEGVVGGGARVNVHGGHYVTGVENVVGLVKGGRVQINVIGDHCVSHTFGDKNLQEKTDDVLQAEERQEDNPEKEFVVTHLQKKVETEKERTFEIRSNDLFRPKLKQIGESLHETKEHFVKSEGVAVVPSAFRPQLTKKLLVVLEKNNWFLEYDLISRRSFKTSCQTKPSGLVFLTTTMLVPFCIQSDHYCTDDIEADVIIFLPNQPVFVLTIPRKDEQTQSKNVTLYNASITRGIVMRMSRFIDEGFKVAFGVIAPKDLENPDVFRSSLEEIVTSSAKYVTFRSMAMDPEKYEKVVTAFWACMTETKCVDDEEECIRFLTKDQSVVLVENISRGGVQVLSSGGSGTSVLLAEVSRRLSHCGKTLFLVEKKEDLQKYKKLIPSVTTSTDLTDVKVKEFKCIVDETANPGISANMHWKRHRIDEQGTLEDDQEGSHKKQRLSVEELGSASAGPDVPRDVAIDTKDRTIHLPLLELDKTLLNTARCQIREDNVMENISLKGKSEKTYKRLWGTSARLPVGEQELFYWEVHNKVLPKNSDSDLAYDTSLQNSFDPLIETGLVRTTAIDKRTFTFQAPGSVCLLLRGCKKHNKYCLQIVKDEVATCTDDDFKIANNASFNYGILYDRSRGIIAFRNVKTGVHLGSVSYVTDEELLPVFALTHTKAGKVLVKLKLVCGSNIEVNDDLRTFFENCCEEKVKI